LRAGQLTTTAAVFLRKNGYSIGRRSPKIGESPTLPNVPPSPRAMKTTSRRSLPVVFALCALASVAQGATTIDEAQKLSQETGRPIFAVAGSAT
jgi:hypothetical protein